jgi:hypothetical protein
MKTQTSIKYIFLLLGTSLFNYLFWQESHGINTLIYSIFILISVSFFEYKSGNQKKSIPFLLSILLTAIAVTWHGSTFAIVMYYASLTLFAGFLHEKQLKSQMYILAASFLSLVKLPPSLINSIPLKSQNKQKFKKVLKIIKLSLLPVIVLLIFYLIYINANPVFDNYASKTFNKIGQFLSAFFSKISFVRILFILLGLYLTAWFLFRTNIKYLHEKEATKNENLLRKRVKQLFPNPEYIRNLKENMPVLYRKRFALSFKLKNEYLSALVLLVLVNSLLLIVNSIDIKWVWFGFEYSEEFDLKQFVHEGTYLLIISILLSMAIMLRFFRRNLNFYNKSKILKRLSYLWIGQNLVLAISVAIRNLHYITYWGLAYKRIGVFLFLIAVSYGLYSLFIKIRHTKTSYFLLKNNSRAVLIILVSASLLNWDGIIANHNLNHPIENHMETSFLLTMSDKILPLIDKKKSILEQEKYLNTYANFTPYDYKEYYKLRVDQFIQRYEKESWTSWNYKEWKTYQYFKNKP